MSLPALILAAGAGRRMGGPKALLTLDGETLLRRAARAALDAGFSPVLAVVGPWDPGLEGLEVQAILNPEAEEGMASSIRAGVAALPPDAEALLLLAVDQPAVDAPVLDRLRAVFEASASRPAACAYAGTLGIPAILPARLFPGLAALRGDRGAKALLLREDTAVLPFPEGARDLDCPADLEGLKR